MRGDIVYRIYGVHTGRSDDTPFGTCRTQDEAEKEIAAILKQHGAAWQQKYHDQGFVIRPASIETDFEIPSLPKPRDTYVAVASPKPNRPGTWDSSHVRVYRRGPDGSASEQVAEYERNYSLLQTFEPFRKHGRDYALISRSYTCTAVLDLSSGTVIAEEYDPPSGNGFCPVGFYVPDWWDLHDESIIPGSPFWTPDREWPGGDFGFVWGCIWGDDSSWKLQYLDLSRIEEGVISREERFGYLEVATRGYRPPSLNSDQVDPVVRSQPPPFIKISRYQGRTTVSLDVEMDFNLDSGTCKHWARKSHPFDDEE